MKILVTGFKPFLNEKINPSELLSVEMSQKFSDVTSLILPVEFGNSFAMLNSHLALNNYDYVIMLGQAAGRDKVTLEKIALNWIQAEYQDESGVLPGPGVIIKDKPLALMSGFPIDEVYAELKKQNLPIEISFSAGTFVCNDLYFRVLEKFTDLKSVFVHVPLVKEQIGESHLRPFLSLDEQQNILSQMIQWILINCARCD